MSLFGESVSISGDVAVIGAYGDDHNGPISGSAFVYQFDGSGWERKAKLLPDDGESSNAFGSSVSVSGNRTVIGARWDNDNGIFSGSAYVYRYDGAGWIQEAKLLPTDGAVGDAFGSSASISGDVVAIGAIGSGDNGKLPGACYIFRLDGTQWVQEAKLLPDDGEPFDNFGLSISISGDTAVIGAPSNFTIGGQTGSAYVFRHDGTNWVQEAKLLPWDDASRNLFGQSVSIFDNLIVIGAHLDDDNGGLSGAAYVFRHDGSAWAPEAKLLAADGDAHDRFGSSVAVSGITAVIGSNGDDDNGVDSGSAYVFRFDGVNWLQATKLLPATMTAGDEFGFAVAVSEETVAIGARKDDTNEINSGSAYIFDLNCSPPCLPDVNGDGVLTPTDFTAWINAFNNTLPKCDQNGDGSCDPTDLTAWIANYNGGC